MAEYESQLVKRCAHCYMKFAVFDFPTAEVCPACMAVLALQKRENREEQADSDPEFVRQMRYRSWLSKPPVCKCGRINTSRWVLLDCYACRSDQ